MSPHEDAKRLIDEEGAVLIDCREGYEWDEMRIPGAKLVPLSEYEGDPEMVEEVAARDLPVRDGQPLAGGRRHLRGRAPRVEGAQPAGRHRIMGSARAADRDSGPPQLSPRVAR